MVRMNNGRYLMAREKDILAFFAQHKIVGKTITGIYPDHMDYGISNWDELLEENEDISPYTTTCGIQTDGFVFLELDFGDWLEIHFSGSGGPVVLHMASGDRPYPRIPADLFSLNTLFRGCRGKKIVKVMVDRNNERMLFLCFCGIDMSEEDEGVWQIRLVLEDGSQLAFNGSVDWSCVDYLDAAGALKTVPMWWLLPNPEKLN